MIDFNKNINRLGTYCTQWDYVEDRFGQADLLPFTISDMDLEAPEEIIKALIKRINHGVYGYSRWNHDDFKNSIANWYSKRYSCGFNKDYIVYSPSVIYSVAKLIEILTDEGDGILIHTPGYDGFFCTLEGNNRKIVTSKLKEVDGSYEIDFEDFDKKCRDVSIFLLCNPHNPTGRVWRKDELERIVQICKKNNVKIISDDIHMDITYKRRYIPIFNVTLNHDDIIICSAASKTFNLPALTGSYIIIPNENIRNEFLIRLKNKDALSSPAILGVIATMQAYNNCEYWLEELLVHTKENIEFVKKYLEDNIPALKCNIPDGLYFVWIDFSELGVSSEQIQDVLINEGKVAIMPGKIYGNGGENYLRLNIACSRTKLKDGLNRLKNSIEYIQTQKGGIDGGQ